MKKKKKKSIYKDTIGDDEEIREREHVDEM